jgi:8-oxo-dGTP pyrophosphatase MutT (NUDIX family)
VKAQPFSKQVGDLVQVGCLPLTIAEDASTKVLLVTSRDTKRWIIPKGWPMKGRKPSKAAAQEALEEAGVIGEAAKKPVGSYRYRKRREVDFDVCEVQVYELAVRKQLKKWQEKGQRERRWFTLEEAAASIEEADLAALLRRLSQARGHISRTRTIASAKVPA